MKKRYGAKVVCSSCGHADHSDSRSQSMCWPAKFVQTLDCMELTVLVPLQMVKKKLPHKITRRNVLVVLVPVIKSRWTKNAS